MTTVRAALARAATRLGRAGVPTPSRDARKMMAFVLGTPHSRLALMLPEPLTEAALSAFRKAVERRANRQPVSQIIGCRDFFGRGLLVTPAVPDPRPHPDRPYRSLGNNSLYFWEYRDGSQSVHRVCRFPYQRQW